MSSLYSSRLFTVVSIGRVTPHASSNVAGQRNYSDINYIKSNQTAHLKRGRGGRSSFSGNVATLFGATGFLGRFVATKLGKTGTQMIFPYRCEPYDMKHLKQTGDLGQNLYTPFHLMDEDSIAKAVKHANVVVNMIGRDWDTKHFSLEQVHVEGAARIARLSKEAGVDKFIHISHLNCDTISKGNIVSGGSKVLKAKKMGEEAVLSEFPDAIILRPSDLFGQNDQFLRYYSRYARRGYRYMGLHNGGYDIFKQPLYAGDLGEAITKIITKDVAEKGTIYQAAGPHRYELRDLVEYILRVLRRDSKSVDGVREVQVIDLKFQPLILLRAKLNEFLPSHPIGHLMLDKLERETVTDVVSDSLLSINDLGINLSNLEDRIQWEIKYFRAWGDYVENLNDFPEPEGAKFTVPGVVKRKY